ncbi:MAG: FAD-binding protein [Gammaproteobacteria bacterium]|uniref:FAD-binding protein n=1 Tax=Candidatus Thiopontia autotrophica TaxID=2841688 RepID=A0A8J6P453_9GAMM|nr:FAD-binding protein [Candidatus Thiopontia autotrophica]MBL6969649.1 FAD-binding protein [Gammaproteobacteria bacterium]
MLSRFRSIVGDDGLLDDSADLLSYSYDNSRISTIPEAALLPSTHNQVVEIVRVCREHHIPITPRGRGSGTSGAAVPEDHGIVLSTERMRSIIRVDTDNRLMIVQPGVTNQEVQQEASRHGFFWAPDPSSSSFCSVGGNIACGSAGPRAVKYGTVRENILGLRAVTGDGKEIKTGTETTKWAVGYDLTRLIVGSEGTLAIVTEATLKLLPKQQKSSLMRALYRDMQSAADAVAAIMAQPFTPSALEFMDSNSLGLIRSQLGSDFPAEAGAMLMIEADGSIESVKEAAEALQASATNSGMVDFYLASTEAEVKQLWKARKILSPRLREVSPKKINEDIVVPVSSIPELIASIDSLSTKHQIMIANFGHAGNGNLHTNLLINPDDSAEMARAEECLDEIFQTVLELNGSISGEHGVGLIKQKFVSREIPDTERRLMSEIKLLFDPDSILNPGKGPQQ